MRTRLTALFAAFLTLGLIMGAPAPAVAAAQACTFDAYDPSSPAPEDPDDIKACIDRFENASSNTNAVSIDVVITDRTTGLPPAVPYGVFLSVHPAGAEATANPAACQEPHFFTNPEYPRGVYRCSWIVDGPDPYVFDVTINKAGDGASGIQQLLTVSQTLVTPDAARIDDYRGLRYVVEGSTFEVFLLQAHVATASVWLLAVTVMAFLAVPRLRRMLSTLTLHTLEVRRAFLNSLMWAMFGCVVGTGVYLLRTQTAYEAPFTPSAWENVSKLPYATTYFAALYGKIAIFLAMGAAGLVLAREAARQARLAGDTGWDDDGFDEDMWGRSLTAIGEPGGPGPAGEVAARAAVRARPRVDEGVGARTLWLCVLTVAAGLGAVGVCVTVLKYTHELVEMLVAAKTVAGG